MLRKFFWAEIGVEKHGDFRKKNVGRNKRGGKTEESKNLILSITYGGRRWPGVPIAWQRLRIGEMTAISGRLRQIRLDFTVRFSISIALVSFTVAVLGWSR